MRRGEEGEDNGPNSEREGSRLSTALAHNKGAGLATVQERFSLLPRHIPVEPAVLRKVKRRECRRRRRRPATGTAAHSGLR